ncbi:hypothetical protein XELAEV_18024603mg [Xenopus laevis]|uniref:Uncharacterized protein n=1 Tax=Xenopus laevis TaxID=8355 RepID=A0A974D0T5_XENLA|nr:hypothetical protein XELAEV_18024603mg [Xenopus laevis]
MGFPQNSQSVTGTTPTTSPCTQPRSSSALCQVVNRTHLGASCPLCKGCMREPMGVNPMNSILATKLLTVCLKVATQYMG